MSSLVCLGDSFHEVAHGKLISAKDTHGFPNKKVKSPRHVLPDASRICCPVLPLFVFVADTAEAHHHSREVEDGFQEGLWGCRSP